MPLGVFSHAQIKGIACAVPDNVVMTESYYDKFGKDTVDKFMKMTGIRSRHIALGEQCTSDLCFAAADSLIHHLNWEPGSIGALIHITSTPDYKLPSTACILHHRLGLSKDCAAFDINLGCSAYPYGLWLAASIMQSGSINRVILTVGNQNNINIDPNDRSTAMLFGDAGSATFLERQEGCEVKYILKTDGSGFRHIIVPAGSARNRGCSEEAYLHADGTFRSDYRYYLNGADVFNFTITEVPQTISELMTTFDIKNEDVDLFVLHQANLFILQRIAAKLKIPAAKLPITIGTYGNTSGASIPLTLVDCIHTAGRDKVKTLLCGFGVGLSWGAMYLEIDKSVCIPLIRTNDFFTGGRPDA